MKNQPGSDSRDTSRVNTLGVYSNSQSSYLGLGTSGTKVYVGHSDTSFATPIKVAEIQEKNDGGGIKISDRLDFGQQDTLMKIVPDNGTTQNIDLFGNNNTPNLTTLKVNINGATYKNAIEFESGPSSSKQVVLRLDSNTGVKIRNLNMDDTKITKLAEPTNDTDAANKQYVDERDELLRQDIIELEEEINAIAPSVEYGTWEFSLPANNPRPPSTGTFYLLDGAGQYTADYNQAVGVAIHNKEFDQSGGSDPVNVHTWNDANVGELIQLFDAADPDFLLGKITAKNVDTVAECVYFTIDRIQASGVTNNTPTASGDYLTRINVFKEPSGGTASDFVLKTGDTMTGNLEIKTPDIGEAKLTLRGKQENTNNATATIAFKSQFDTSDQWDGYLTYNTTGKSADNYFKFNRDVDFGTRGLKSVYWVQFISSGKIKHNDNDRIKFQKKDTANDGDGLIQFERPTSDGRRGITIRGLNPDDNTETDILWTYTNAVSGDAINYAGKMANDTNIVNKKYVDDGVAALLARIEELENNSGTGGGSGSMSRNIRFTLTSSSSSPGFLQSNKIKNFDAKSTTLYVNASPVAFKPQGRINISEVDRDELGPIWSFHITSVNDYGVNDKDEPIVELGVALEGSTANGGDFNITSGRSLYVSLVDGAWDEEATVEYPIELTTNSSSFWSSSTTPVPNSGKLYKLDESGNFTANNYIYGAFIPIDYIQSKFKIKYHRLTDDLSGSFYYSTTDNVVETTVNGVKGIKIWSDQTVYYTSTIPIEIDAILASYLPDA